MEPTGFALHLSSSWFPRCRGRQPCLWQLSELLRKSCDVTGASGLFAAASFAGPSNRKATFSRLVSLGNLSAILFGQDGQQ